MNQCRFDIKIYIKNIKLYKTFLRYDIKRKSTPLYDENRLIHQQKCNGVAEKSRKALMCLLETAWYPQDFTAWQRRQNVNNRVVIWQRRNATSIKKHL